MADYISRLVHSTRYEFTLPTPTNIAEIGKAYAGAKITAEGLGVSTQFDDWLTVTVGDDEIIMSFTTNTRAPKEH